MQKIESYEALAAGIARQMRPGVCTNAFYSADEYARAIADGALFGQEADGGLHLLWARDGYDRLSFWHTDPDAPLAFTPRRATVLEIAYRARDTALRTMGQRWVQAGFTPLFDRVRLTHPAWTPPACTLDAAAPSDAAQVEAILRASFHPMAGCLPTAAELPRALAAGSYLCRRAQDGTICAILHFTTTKSAAKLCHLAVLPQARRHGAASALFAAFQAATGGCRSVVWTQEKNQAALALYKSLGYVPDGWRSGVWLWN